MTVLTMDSPSTALMRATVGELMAVATMVLEAEAA